MKTASSGESPQGGFNRSNFARSNSSPEEDRTRVAIVLAGGGAKGIFQSGALHAFHVMNLKPDVIAGTSVGAINAAAMAELCLIRSEGDQIVADKLMLKLLSLWQNIDYLLPIKEGARLRLRNLFLMPALLTVLTGISWLALGHLPLIFEIVRWLLTAVSGIVFLLLFGGLLAFLVGLGATGCSKKE